MKRFLVLCCLLIVQVAHAQIEPLDFAIYRGNYGERQLLLPLADSAKTVTATAFYSRNGNPLPSVSQPVIIRSASPGTQAIIRFERTDILPDVGWVEVYVSGQIRASGRLIVGKNAQGSPGTPPVGTPTPAPGSTTLSLIKIYPVSGILSGYIINHNLQTKLVRISAFWNDSGQLDPLWFGVIETANTIHMWGPPTESFTGNIVVEPLK